jgi:hypothetical protein
VENADTIKKQRQKFHIGEKPQKVFDCLKVPEELAKI